MLADLAGVGPLDQWFGEEGHLEFWVRRADVRARAFDRAWMLLR
ncbi:MAG: YwqG family protein [Actinomycetota bacterium]|nr:YwqG family protein [Actinomycetota bacterium]